MRDETLQEDTKASAKNTSNYIGKESRERDLKNACIT